MGLFSNKRKQQEAEFKSKAKDICSQLIKQSKVLSEFVIKEFPGTREDCVLIEVLSYNYAYLSFGKNLRLSEDYYSLTSVFGDAPTIIGDYYVEFVKDCGKDIKTKEAFLAFTLYLNNWEHADPLFFYRLCYILQNNDCAPIQWTGFDELAECPEAEKVAGVIGRYIREVRLLN